MTLQLHEVVKHYRSSAEVVRAVDGVTLSVEQGEMVAVFGPSGSGKTTLLMLAAALLQPDSGTITVHGKSIVGLPSREATRYRREVISVVFQSPHLLAGVTALENAALKLLADPVSLTKARRKARPWLKRMGLDSQGQRLPTELSGGERQRVASARALASEPQLLLADEPTANLDTQRSLELLELLHDIAHHRGTAILLATHDPQAARIADRSVTLRDGRLLHSPPPDLIAQVVPAPRADA